MKSRPFSTKHCPLLQQTFIPVGHATIPDVVVTAAVVDAVVATVVGGIVATVVIAVVPNDSLISQQNPKKIKI